MARQALTQLAVGVVLLERRRVEVHAPVRHVRVAVVDDALDHADDLVHVLPVTLTCVEHLRDAGDHVGGAAAKGLHVLEELLLVLTGQLCERDVALV